jgi:hypothetical protein
MCASAAPTRIIPFLRDLNPQKDDLRAIIVLAHRHRGKREALAKAIFVSWTKRATRHGFSEHSILANTIASLGPENLGVLTESGQLTSFGAELYRLRNRPDAFRDAVSQHLLRNRGGWQFCRALQVLSRLGKPSRKEVADYLAQKYGIEEWRDYNNLSSLHNFLAWGGVVNNYRLDEAEFERLFGVSATELEGVEALPQQTRVCLEALVRLGGTATAGQIRGVAEAYTGRLMDVHQMPAILKPLYDHGFVTFEGERGKRTSTYAIVDSEKGQILARVAEDLSVSGVVPDEVFQNTFAWVLARLEDATASRDERGRALEILAAKICWRLGLRHIQIRLRTEFEVDVVADRIGMGYQAWSVQCKAYGNSQVRSEHILREFGIAMLVGYDVLVFITTAAFSDDALATISRIMRKTHVLVVPVSGKDLHRFAEDEDRVFAFIDERSVVARNLRRGAEVGEVLRELDVLGPLIDAGEITQMGAWARLQVREVFVERDVFDALYDAWLNARTEHQAP